MNLYLKVAAVVVGSHLLRWGSEYMYYTQCGGFFNSIFAWGSPTCRGLKWVSESATMNILDVARYGGYSLTQ